MILNRIIIQAWKENCPYDRNIVYNVSRAGNDYSKINDILPSAIPHLDKLMTNIDKVLNTSVRNYENVEWQASEMLLECIETVNSFVCLMRHISSNPLVTLECFRNAPKTVAAILLLVFHNCKKWEANFKPHMEGVRMFITNVFKTAFELQCSFFIILLKHLKYDTVVDGHLHELIQIVEIMADVGEVVFSLDIKTMSEQWKGYLSICKLYSESLKQKLIHNKAIVILCRQIRSNVNAIDENENSTEALRCLKINKFLLKILQELNTEFSGCLSADLDALISCLSFLYQKSSSGEFQSKLNFIGADAQIQPLLNALVCNLLSDKHFKMSLKKNNVLARNKELKLGYLLLCMKIMQLIVKENNDVNKECFNFVLCLVFQIIDDYKMELISRNDDLEIENYVKIDVYQYCLLNVSALIIAHPSEEEVESILLQNILQFKIFTSTFAHDVWITIMRHISSEACFNHLNNLIALYEEFEGLMKKSPQEVFLSSLISNLFEILSDEDKDKMYEKYPLKDGSNIWNTIGLYNLPEDIVHNEIIKVMNFESFGIEKITDIKSYDEYIRKLNILTTIIPEQIEENDFDALRNKLTYDWKVISSPNFINTKEKTLSETEWFHNLVVSLSRLTGNYAQYFTNDDWIKTFTSLSTQIMKSSSILKIATLDLLQSFMYIQMKDDHQRDDLITLISTIFRVLINDSDVIVATEALRLLIELTMNIDDESLIRSILKTERNLKKKITHLISKKKKISNGTDDLFRDHKDINFVHKCELKVTNLIEENMVLDATSDDEELSCHIEELKLKSKSFYDRLSSKSLSVEQKRELGNVIDLLNAAVKK